MNFSPKALLEVIAELGNKFPSYSKPLWLGLPTLFIWFFLLPLLSGIRMNDHLLYLLNKDQQHKQAELADQVDLINKLIDEHEYHSFDHQQQMSDSITFAYKDLSAKNLQCGNVEQLSNIGRQASLPRDKTEGTKMSLEKCYSLALRANSNTHEVIRAFLQINRVYGDLLRSGKDDTSIHRFITDLYASLQDLTANDLKCDPVYRTYSNLRALHNRIDILPDEVQDTLNIEVLRLLTYAAAFLANERSSGTCRAPEDPATYVNAQQIYTQRAREIKDKTYRGATSSIFLRKLFWIDMSDFTIAINAGNESESDKIYERLSKQLPPEFLKSRLQQYSDNILKSKTSPDSRPADLIKKYIAKL